MFSQAVTGIEKHIDVTAFITRQMFNEQKDNCPYIKYNWSFGNSGKGYMYSQEIEQWKHCLHNAIFFFDVSDFKRFYNIEMPVYEHIKNRKQRRMAYANYIKANFQNKKPDCLKNLEEIERIESLERLQSLERQTLTIHNKSYADFDISDGIIYCDIPYKDTECGSYSGFDHNSFYDWAENQKVPVYISEYNMPSDRFTEIASFNKRQTCAGTGSGAEVQEKIFIPKHQQKITQQLTLF